MMPEGELWSTLVTAVDPGNRNVMPAVLQSTIDLLETELAKARAALREIQPHGIPLLSHGDELALGAVAAYRQNLIGRAPGFFYGTRRLSPKEVGLVPLVQEVKADEEEADEFCNGPTYVVTVIPPKRVSLVDVLSNSLILDHMSPYLSVSALFALASTSRHLRAMILNTPYVFRHLDLTQCRGAQVINVTPIESGTQVWRSEHLHESFTEDEFYSGPLRGIFASLKRQSILQDVRTLVLDGLSVPADLVADIVLSDRFNVNILSLRECRHLNERKLMQILQQAVRPTRPKGTPRVKGIYHFTPVNNPRALARSKYRDWWSSRCTSMAEEVPPSQERIALECPQNAWYRPSGKLFPRTIEDGWALTLQKCEGIIAFDAVLCRGPRHNVELYSPTIQSQQNHRPEDRLLGPAIATVALGPRGCDGCHTSPEGPAIWGQSPGAQFPLLIPAPLHSSSVLSAKRPALYPNEHPMLIARCTECLTDRWCHRCHRWFCNNCLPHPEHVRTNLSPHQTAVRGPHGNHDVHLSLEQRRLGSGVSKDCWECGPTCTDCRAACQRICHNCQGGYCVEHNEGCSSTMCDWCNTSARHRMRELY